MKFNAVNSNWDHRPQGVVGGKGVDGEEADITVHGYLMQTGDFTENMSSSSRFV